MKEMLSSEYIDTNLHTNILCTHGAADVDRVNTNGKINNMFCLENKLQRNPTHSHRGSANQN